MGGESSRTKTVRASTSLVAAAANTHDTSPTLRRPSRSCRRRSLVLDGEVAIYDQQLRSRFDWLREPDAEAVATPPVLMAFDLLHQDGREFTGRPLRERRARLEDAVAGSDFVLPVRRLARNGFEAWSEVVARDYEGLVAKEESSLYEAGPTRRWLKVKQKGWTVDEDRWQRRISSRA